MGLSQHSCLLSSCIDLLVGLTIASINDDVFLSMVFATHRVEVVSIMRIFYLNSISFLFIGFNLPTFQIP